MSWFSVFLTIMTKRTFWRYRVLGDGKRFVKTRTIKNKYRKMWKAKLFFPLIRMSYKIFKCAVYCIFKMRFRLIRAPGITHELRSYPAVLSSSYLPFNASRTCTALSHRPSVQWVNTRPWPCTAYLRIRNLKKPMCHCLYVQYYCWWIGWRINKDYSILFYSISKFLLKSCAFIR